MLQSFNEEEQKLFRLYGKLPNKKDLLQNKLKVRDSSGLSVRSLPIILTVVRSASISIPGTTPSPKLAKLLKEVLLRSVASTPFQRTYLT